MEGRSLPATSGHGLPARHPALLRRRSSDLSAQSAPHRSGPGCRLRRDAGNGEVIYAVTFRIPGGRQITDTARQRAAAFDSLSRWSIGPIPSPFVVAIALGIVYWAVLKHLPIGQCMYAVRANPRAAKLTGVPRRRYVFGDMVSSGNMVAIAGVLIASRSARGLGPENVLSALTAKARHLLRNDKISPLE